VNNVVQSDFWLQIVWDVIATLAAGVAGVLTWSVRGRLHRFDKDLADLRKEIREGSEKCRQRHAVIDEDIGFLKGKINSK
jgi:hypothetical protein